MLIVCGNLSDQMILLDGKHFMNCTLMDCVLTYEGDEPVIERSKSSAVHTCSAIEHEGRLN